MEDKINNREEFEALDSKIGELQTDENGREYQMINGKKNYPAKAESDYDRRWNLMMGRFRASGYDSPLDLMKDAGGNLG